MKYVMFEIKHGSLTRRVPIIFPNELVHAEISMYVRKMLKDVHGWDAKTVSAGDVNFAMDCHCSGSSETLGISAQPDIDNNVINMNDYGGSFI